MRREGYARKTFEPAQFWAYISCIGILLIGFPAAAQQETSSKSTRFDFTPIVGYRSPISFGLEPHVQETEPRVVLNGSPSYGFAFGVRINDQDVIEARWTRQKSTLNLEDGDVVSPPERVYLDQWHGDFTHEYILDEWGERARPFIIGSVGATRVATQSGPPFTRFSFGIGGGVKVMAGRHFGLRTQAQWLPVLIDPHATIFCGGGCVAHIGGTLNSQFEFALGPIFRF